VLIHWADLYREPLTSVAALASDTTVADTEVRDRLRSLVAEHQQRRPPTRAQLVRDHLTLEIRPVRSLLSALIVNRRWGPLIFSAITYGRNTPYFPVFFDATRAIPSRSKRLFGTNPNTVGMVGAVAFDLPLNGQWSDLTADFVFFDNDNPDGGYTLRLEEIHSWRQSNRDMESLERTES
jgi:hypothetical protein